MIVTCQNIRQETPHAWLAQITLPADISRLLGVASTENSFPNRTLWLYFVGRNKSDIQCQNIPMFWMTQGHMGFSELEKSWLKFQSQKKKLIPKSGIPKPCLLLELDYILMKNDKVLLWAGASALGFDLTLSGTWSNAEQIFRPRYV